MVATAKQIYLGLHKSLKTNIGDGILSPLSI